jgi:8-oxo-dGTP diphosphatase
MNGVSEVLHVTKNVNWLLNPNECSEISSKTLPPLDLITTAFGLVIYEGKLLLANLYRGWDTPGGHVEKGESPIDTVCREVYEETSVVIHSPQLIGFQRLHIHAEKPENYKYPYPESYQVHYFASVKEIHPFVGDNETKGRGFFTFPQLMMFHNLQEQIGLIKMAFGKE